MSSDLATLFTGRTFEIKIYPFSFEEYMRYFNYDNQYLAFNTFMQDGGMSGSYLYKELVDKNNYLSDIYNTLILRDIVQKYNIKNEDFKNIIMRMGLVYDGINKKIHILLTDFDTDKLVYVRTINSLDTKWFSVNEDGSVKFGLYAETAFTTTFTFFDYEFSNDKSFIEEKYPNIKEA